MIMLLTACSSEGGVAAKLSFKSAASLDYLKSLDGKSVTINGYLATSSPADGSFIFLMNLPYQSCPFCVPNTSQLANTLEVYPKKGTTFAYTNQAVCVTGTLVCAKDNEPFTDEYGYEFNYKLTDGEYKILTDAELSADLALWQKIADSGLVNDVYAMYDYVNFLCDWNEYFVESFIDADGNTVPGYYLYPSDTGHFLEGQYADCNREGYFDELITKIKAFNSPSTDRLAANVEAARALADKGKAKLENGEYTFEHKYVEMFDNEDDVYSIIGGDELLAEFDTLYYEFADWIDSWEL